MIKIGELKTGDQGRKDQELEKIKKNTSSEKNEKQKNKKLYHTRRWPGAAVVTFNSLEVQGGDALFSLFTSLGQVFLPVEIYDHPG